MKRIFMSAVILILALAVLASCGAEDHTHLYTAKEIRVEATHTSGSGGYEKETKETAHLSPIARGKTYTLPHGEAMPQAIELTVSRLSADSIVLTFSEEMIRCVSDDPTEWSYGTSFELRIGATEKFATPTDGGGEQYVLSIVDAAAP